MISKGNHVKFARFVLLAVSEEEQTCVQALTRSERAVRAPKRLDI